MAAGQPGETSLGVSSGAGEAIQKPMLVTDPAEEIWDEEKLEKALKTLKEMHIQLRELRTSIPRLLAPLQTKQPSPQVLYQEFAKAGKTANQEVLQFQNLWHDEDTRSIMEQANKSRADNPKGIKPWKVKDHPDWLTRDTLESSGDA